MYSTDIGQIEEAVEIVETPAETKPVAMKKFVIRRMETLKTTAAAYGEPCDPSPIFPFPILV